MSIINKGTSFSNGEQLTAEKINNLVDDATFDQSATDNASTTVNSTGQIIVADGGITPSKISLGGPSWNTDGSLFTAGERIEINPFLVGDDIAYIDFHSTSVSEPNFDARIYKAAGENSNFQLQNQGTGNTAIYQGGEVKFTTTGGTEGYTIITGGGTASAEGAKISLYGSEYSTSDKKNIYYSAKSHLFRDSTGATSPSYVQMNMTDDGNAELVVESTDSTGDANLTVSSFTPSIILQDKSTGAKDFQITADGSSLIFKSGDTSGDAPLANITNRISSDGTMSFGRNGFSAANAESGVVCSSTGYIYVAREGTDSQTHISFINNATATPAAVGSITTNGSTTSFNTSSDYRLKTDVQPMTGASARVQALNPVNFQWQLDGTRVDGFLAHEAQEVVPEAVHGTKDALDEEGNPEYQGIDQSKLIPLLTKALQEAIARIEVLEAK